MAVAPEPETRPWRLFVAVELPAPLRQALQEPLDGLAGMRDWIRASDPAQVHLTLHFLGGVDVARVPSITAALEPAVGRHARFTLSARGVNAFGGKRRPRVLWAAFADTNVDRIRALRHDTAGALRRAGFEIEPDFRPHLTLGRARRLPPGAGREALERWYAVWKDHEFGPLPVESVHLMRSQLARGPARHSRVASLELQ